MQQYQQTQLTLQLERYLAPFADNALKLNQLIEHIGEFHFDGKAVTELIFKNVIQHLTLPANASVLDIGCALAGVSRYLSRQLNTNVIALDYSKSYLNAAHYLNRILGCEQAINLVQADANQLPLKLAKTDLVCMFHVGMNIREKQKLFTEINSSLKKGGYLVIYDQCRLSSKTPFLPVPWADEHSQDFSSTTAEYQQALTKSGFTVSICENYLAKAKQAIRDSQQQIQKQPSLPLSLLFAQNAEQKLVNMKSNIKAQRIAPFLFLAQKVI